MDSSGGQGGAGSSRSESNKIQVNKQAIKRPDSAGPGKIPKRIIEKEDSCQSDGDVEMRVAN